MLQGARPLPVRSRATMQEWLLGWVVFLCIKTKCVVSIDSSVVTVTIYVGSLLRQYFIYILIFYLVFTPSDTIVVMLLNVAECINLVLLLPLPSSLLFVLSLALSLLFTTEYYK